MTKSGHVIPDKNKNGTDVKTKRIKELSRSLQKTESVMPSRIEANRNGVINIYISFF